MNQSCKSNTWNTANTNQHHNRPMARKTILLPSRAINSFKVPNSLCCLWIKIVQEATSIPFIKYTRKSPWPLLKWLYIQNLHNQQITWLRALDIKGTSQVMDFGQVNIDNVVCAIIVADLAARPVHAFDFRGGVERDRGDGRDVWMPTIMED
jgi:hypothetical protein